MEATAMKENTARIRTFLQDTYTDAQKRLNDAQTKVVELATRAQTSLTEQPVKSKERLEELLSQWTAKELLERLRQNEILKSGETLRSELFGNLGLVSTNDFVNVNADIAGLKDELALLRKRLSTVKGELTKMKTRVRSAPTPSRNGTPTATAKKATPRKSATRKASNKKNPTSISPTTKN
jgi:dsDNA-binding SOS-regulon protein